MTTQNKQSGRKPVVQYRDSKGQFSKAPHEAVSTIIKVTYAVIGEEEQQAVNARDLWKAIGSNRKFADWIKDRIADFIEGQDYLISQNYEIKSRGGDRKSTDYILTLDVAKHLAMLERNDQGRKIRQYFIEIEKEARHRWQNPTPEDRLRNILDHNGAQWILDRLERCDLLEYYAPEQALGTLTKSGTIRSTIRRGSNPVRGGRNIHSILLRAGHPDLFANMIINLLTQGK